MLVHKPYSVMISRTSMRSHFKFQADDHCICPLSCCQDKCNNGSCPLIFILKIISLFKGFRKQMCRNILEIQLWNYLFKKLLFSVICHYSFKVGGGRWEDELKNIYISLFQHIIMKIYNTNKCLCTLSALVPSRLVSLFSLEPLLKMESLKI